MEIIRTAKPDKRIADVRVWHCGGCSVVHMAVGKMVLNFTRDEFAEFADAVVDINTAGWGGGGNYSILDLAAMNRDDLDTVETLH